MPQSPQELFKINKMIDTNLKDTPFKDLVESIKESAQKAAERWDENP